MADYIQFSNIVAQVRRAVKDFNAAQDDLIKMTVNMVYLTEVLQADNLYPFYWLLDFDDSVKSVAPATVSGLSKAASAIITTSSAHGMAVGDLVTVHNVAGMTEINDQIYQVSAVPDSTHITISVDSSGYTTYTSGGTVHHRGTTLDLAGKPIQRITQAAWSDEDKMLQVIPQETDDDVGLFHYIDTTGRPSHWQHAKGFSATGVETNQIIWHPGADAAYRLRYWFEYRPSRLVNDADVPLLPPVFHDAIISGAIVRLAENNVQVENATVWPGIYKAQLEMLKTFNRKWYKDNDHVDRTKPYLL